MRSQVEAALCQQQILCKDYHQKKRKSDPITFCDLEEESKSFHRCFVIEIKPFSLSNEML